VVTRGVDPTLCCYYKSSRIKQYFKAGRALRTETVICDTGDFGVGRPSARRIGMPFAALANPPTGVSVTSKRPTRAPPLMWPPFAR